MAYWLLKTEPDAFSWDDQLARGTMGEPWTGVRNHQAKNHIRAMQAGDLAFLYHTGTQRQIVGVVEIVSDPFPDPTDPAWLAVTCVAKAALVHPVGLTAIKADAELTGMALVTHPRLSVQPVAPQAWQRILDMGATSL